MMSRIGEYIVTDPIGKGTFGDVYTVHLEKEPKNVVVIKKINLTTCSDKDKQRAHDEVKMLRSLNHEHVVRYRDSFTYEHYLCIVMEYCKAGTLRQYVERQRDQIPEQKCKDFLKQLVTGVKYLHSQDIIHRDLKPKNVFLTADEVIKIGDLGVAKLLKYPQFQELTKGVGTPFYMSPEMINNMDYDKQTDIWSLGCCVYEIATKEVAFTAETISKLRVIVSADELPARIQSIPYSDSFQRFLVTMLQQDPAKRPTTADVLDYLETSMGDTATQEIYARQLQQYENKDTMPAETKTAKGTSKVPLLARTFPGTGAMTAQLKEAQQKLERSRMELPGEKHPAATSDLGESTSTISDGTGTLETINRLQTLKMRPDVQQKVEQLKSDLAKAIGERTVETVLELIEKTSSENSYQKALKEVMGQLSEINKPDLLCLRTYVLSMKGKL